MRLKLCSMCCSACADAGHVTSQVSYRSFLRHLVHVRLRFWIGTHEFGVVINYVGQVRGQRREAGKCLGLFALLPQAGPVALTR
jgi:hypothetical protein